MGKELNGLCLISSILFGCISQSAYALYDRDKDPYYKTALSEAASTFSKYTVQCEGKNFAKITDNAFIEFNEPQKEVRMIGAYGVSDSDRLNGKEWAGKFDVVMGKAARIISVDRSGATTVRDWEDSSEPEFDLILNNRSWKVGKSVQVYLNAWYELKTPISCSEISVAKFGKVSQQQQSITPAPAPAAAAETVTLVKASFDCKKASTAVEGMICGSAELASLDVRLSKAYKSLRNEVDDKDTLKSEQISWVRQRNSCSSVECLKAAYTERAADLEKSLSH